MVDLELYQGSIFDELFEKKVITKKIRLIELFSGIVTTVLVGLFGTMTNKDYEQIIKDYVERITND